MDERGIIIADSDAEYCNEVADHFRKAGYRVETTDSAVHVLCSILEKQTPVLLLGSNFDKKICSADLIHLLKKCNRNLHVIMVSEDMPLAQVRKVREEGIFYHALKPAAAGDTEELGLAVKCAFEQNRASGKVHHEQPAQAEWQSPEKPLEEMEHVTDSVKPMRLMLALVTLIAGLSYLAVVASDRVMAGSSMAIWCFLSFCALIIATQLLPIFRIKLPVRGSEQHSAKQRNDPLDRE